jgi:MFS family permease
MTADGKFSRFNDFYGWYVVASSFVILFFNSGARFSIGVMFKPLISEFGWDRGAVSFAFSVNMTIFAISLLIVGKLYDRYGPKWVILVSTALLSGGYMSISLIKSYWQFLLFYGILSAAGLGGTSVPLVASLTSKWFEKGRGLAISLALSGTCLGHFVLVPFYTELVLGYGWRVSYFWIGLIMLVVNGVLALWVIRGDPENLGRRPFGYRREGKPDTQEMGTAEVSGVKDFGLGKAMGTYSFWFFAFVMFVCGSGDFLVTTHLIPFVTDHGISPTKAGQMLALYGLLSMGGLLVIGPVTDWIGNKIPVALTFLIRFLLFLLILRYQNEITFYIFSMLFGFTFLITAPVATTLTGRLYGYTHIGVLSGFVSTIHHFGGGLMAYLGGEIWDKTGSYQPAFVLSAIMAAAAVVLMLFIREKRHF